MDSTSNSSNYATALILGTSFVMNEVIAKLPSNQQYKKMVGVATITALAFVTVSYVREYVSAKHAGVTVTFVCASAVLALRIEKE